MQILQISTATPRNEYSTEELMKLFPTQIPNETKQNILNLGVSKRHLINHAYSQSKPETILSETELVELCSEACEKAMEKASLSIKNIDFLITAYDVNPILCPGLSQRLIREIGFNPYVDYINAQGMACGAFTNALSLAENYLAAHPRNFVLLCISGVNSYWFYNQVRGIKDLMGISQINSIKDVDRRHRELRKWIATMEFFLFGDGVASAVVAKDGGGLSVKRIVEVTNLKKKDYEAGYARLAALNEPFKFGFCSHLGREIPKLGVRYTSVALKRLLGKNSASVMGTVKRWAIHTGSEKILDTVAEHHQISQEKIRESYEVLKEYGNLAGASLPFILERIVSEDNVLKDDVVLMLGYGWGFSASAAMLESER